jgi:hypothetical protein
MLHFKMNALLACSLGFCLATGTVPRHPKPTPYASPTDPDRSHPDNHGKGKGKHPDREKTTPPSQPTDKPNPKVSPQEPEDEPETKDENNECDECQIVKNPGGKTEGWPTAMARTLWGLFFVGRPGRRKTKAEAEGVPIR